MAPSSQLLRSSGPTSNSLLEAVFVPCCQSIVRLILILKGVNGAKVLCCMFGSEGIQSLKCGKILFSLWIKETVWIMCTRGNVESGVE